MKSRFLGVLIGLLWCGLAARGQGDPAVESALTNWVATAQARVNLGQEDEKDYDDLLHKADDMFAAHKDLRVLLLKMQIYLDIVTNNGRFDQAIACIQQVKKDFPDTRQGRSADAIIDQITKDKIFSSLEPGVPMPDFSAQDSDGQALSLAAHKGKVLLLDFWATWCMPCMIEFPTIKSLYSDFHDKGLDIIGVDLDDDPGKFESFIKARGVTWPQYFEGQGWTNKLVAQYGISGIPATFLLDTNGVILGKNLKPQALSEAVAKALAAK
jgi:thiol-disulfide isomerase/thioredoxin